MNSLMVGDNVSWLSVLGYCQGTVEKVILAKNANNELVPWIVIEYKTQRGTMNTVRLCATESNLKMMKVEIMEVA